VRFPPCTSAFRSGLRRLQRAERGSVGVLWVVMEGSPGGRAVAGAASSARQRTALLRLHMAPSLTTGCCWLVLANLDNKRRDAVKIDHHHAVQIEQAGLFGDCVQSWLHSRVGLDSYRCRRGGPLLVGAAACSRYPLLWPNTASTSSKLRRLDRIAATQHLCEHDDTPPVLVLTTFDDDEMQSAALRSATAGFYPQGLPGQDVAGVIERAAADGSGHVVGQADCWPRRGGRLGRACRRPHRPHDDPARPGRLRCRRDRADRRAHRVAHAAARWRSGRPERPGHGGQRCCLDPHEDPLPTTCRPDGGLLQRP